MEDELRANGYALMVMDNALMQLGGLAFGSAFNKIAAPKAACLLAALVAFGTFRQRLLYQPLKPLKLNEMLHEYPGWSFTSKTKTIPVGL